MENQLKIMQTALSRTPSWMGKEIITCFVIFSESTPASVEICQVLTDSGGIVTVLDEKSIAAYWQPNRSIDDVYQEILIASQTIRRIIDGQRQRKVEISLVLHCEQEKNLAALNGSSFFDRKRVSSSLKIAAEVAQRCLYQKLDLVLTQQTYEKLAQLTTAKKAGELKLPSAINIVYYQMSRTASPNLILVGSKTTEINKPQSEIQRSEALREVNQVSVMREFSLKSISGAGGMTEYELELD